MHDPALSILAIGLFVLTVVVGCTPDRTESPDETTTQEAAASKLPAATVYKSPTCGCCKKWVAHLHDSGFTVETQDLSNAQPTKDQLGVPRKLRSCHTAVIGEEVIEGHVPAELIKKYLRNDSAKAAGLAVPGMPVGSPGMEIEGRPAQPYQVMAFRKDGRAGVYAQR